jgi:hypothetical protein
VLSAFGGAWNVILKRIYMVWFGLGATAFFHGVITGGGLEGAILSWQIEHWRKIHPSSVQVPLGFALIPPDASIARCSGPLRKAD